MKGITVKRIVAALSFLIYISFFIAITDTTDWDGYIYLFKHDDFPTDLMFRYLSILAKSFGYEFIHVYKLHVILTGLFFVNFLSKFTKNTIFIVTMLVLLSYVPLANQIRYFLAFSIFLNGYFYLNKRVLLGIFLLCLAVTSHTGILALILVALPAMLIKSSKTLIVWSIIVTIGIFFFFKPILASLGLNHDRLEIYLGSTYSTSILGALFQVFPVIIVSLLSLILLRNRLATLNGSEESFILLRLGLVSLTFLPLSFLSQIFFGRYSFALLFVWALIVMCLKEKSFLRTTLSSTGYLFVVQLVLHIYYWSLPILLLDSRDTLEKMELLVESFSLTYSG